MYIVAICRLAVSYIYFTCIWVVTQEATLYVLIENNYRCELLSYGSPTIFILSAAGCVAWSFLKGLPTLIFSVTQHIDKLSAEQPHEPEVSG